MKNDPNEDNDNNLICEYHIVQHVHIDTLYLLFKIRVRVRLQLRAHKVLSRIEDIVDMKMRSVFGCHGQHGTQALERRSGAASFQDPTSRRHEHATFTETTSTVHIIYITL